MRKRTITRKEGPRPTFGLYGGQPLWTLNRDIEKVIADNHPRLRRMKRVKEVSNCKLKELF
jgi:hypothetical protein